MRPIAKALYSMVPTELKELKEQLQELLHKGFSDRVLCPRCLGPVYQKERWIFENVYRLSRLNKVTVKIKYPLPRIDRLFDQLQGAQDLIWPLPVSCHAIRTDECPHSLHGFDI